MRPNGPTYDAFISYNRAVDGKLAPALQRALHGFARPWYRLRAVRVFRDDASLSANPGLWSSIEQALRASAFFILLASPQAARSKWVGRETGYWVQHKPTANLLIVLTDGELVWDEAAGDFDWEQTTALPSMLRGAFTEEPRYIDLRWARIEEHISLHSPSFRECVADLAAPLHGRDKDELVGEDVRQHRRTKRIARSAVASLVALALTATGAAKLAVDRATEARHERDTATSRQLAAQARLEIDSQLARSALLSLAALDVAATAEARGALLAAIRRASPLLSSIETQPNPIVPAVAWSPTGGMLAWGQMDGTVALWDVQQHRRSEPPLVGHRDREVDGLAFSPSGELLASASTDGTVRLWDLRTHRQRGRPLEGPGDSVDGVAFSPGGELLASAGNGKVRLWNVATGRRAAAPLAADGFAFHPNGRILGLARDDQVLLWDLQASRPLTAHASPHGRLAGQLAFDRQGGTLATTTQDDEIVLWDVTPLRPRGPPLKDDQSRVGRSRTDEPGTRILQAGDRDRLLITFDPEADILAAGGLDDSIVFWDVQRHQLLGHVLMSDTERAYGLAYSPDGARVIAGTSHGHVLIWDLIENKALDTRLRGHEARVNTVAFSPDGQKMASGDWDGTTLLWDVTSRRTVGRPLVGNGQVKVLAFSPDGNTLASGGVSDEVVLWDVQHGERIIGLPGHGDIVFHLAFSPDGLKLATVGEKRGDGPTKASLYLWDGPLLPPQPRRLLTDEKVGPVAFSPDGRTLAVARDKSVYFYDVRTGRPTGQPLRGHVGDSGVTVLAFAADGKTLATGGGTSDRTVILWDTDQRRRLGVLTGHNDAMTGVAFSPDGRTLASSNADGSLMLWDVESRQRLGDPLRGHGDAVVEGLAFGPGGNTVATAGWDGRVVLWDLRLSTWIERACLLASRNLTKAEWDRFLLNRPYEKTCPDLPSGPEAPATSPPSRYRT